MLINLEIYDLDLYVLSLYSKPKNLGWLNDVDLITIYCCVNLCESSTSNSLKRVMLQIVVTESS